MSACLSCGADTSNAGDALCDACLAVELDGMPMPPVDEPAPFELSRAGRRAVAWLMQHDADAQAFMSHLQAGRS